MKKRLLKRIAAELIAGLMVVSAAGTFGMNINAEEPAIEEVVLQSETDADSKDDYLDEKTDETEDVNADEENYGRTAVDGGKDGGVSWKYFSDGYLDINITGDLSDLPENPNDYYKINWPWSNYLDSVKTVKASGSGFTVAHNMFRDLKNVTSIDVSGLDTGKVVDMGAMFMHCEKLEKLDVSNFNTSKTTNMNDMFGYCRKLKNINVKNFDTSKVKQMCGTFWVCESLKTLDVSNFDTTNVTAFVDFCAGCRKLTTIDISSFDISGAAELDYGMDGFFGACDSLIIIKTPKKLSSVNIELPAAFYNKAGKERTKIIDVNDIYTRSGLMVMYRLYNPNSGEHFYTGSYPEIDTIVAAGWKNEGIAWIAPKKSKTPVYRLYNPNAGDHHFTASADEKNNLVNAGWKYEGIAWYSGTEESGEPVFRLYNPNAESGAHHYTSSVAEKNHLTSIGWNYEGVAWFGI